MEHGPTLVLRPVQPKAPRAVEVHFVGDCAWPEFREVHVWLAEHSRLTTAPDIAAAARQISAAPCDPELIVLAQAWPGQYTAREIELLRRQAPLARICELLGAWCEGAARTDRPAEGTIRLYWHQWLARMRPEFERTARGERTMWSLPITAGDDERLLAIPDDRPYAPRGLLAIDTPHAETARALCDACPTRGFAGIWLRAQRGPYLTGIRAAIWEVALAGRPEFVAPGDVAIPDWSADLSELRRQIGDVPIIALIDFPRAEDHAQLRAAGIASIASRPFWLDDLFRPLDW